MGPRAKVLIALAFLVLALALSSVSAAACHCGACWCGISFNNAQPPASCQQNVTPGVTTFDCQTWGPVKYGDPGSWYSIGFNPGGNKCYTWHFMNYCGNIKSGSVIINIDDPGGGILADAKGRIVSMVSGPATLTVKKDGTTVGQISGAGGPTAPNQNTTPNFTLAPGINSFTFDNTAGCTTISNPMKSCFLVQYRYKIVRDIDYSEELCKGVGGDWYEDAEPGRGCCGDDDPGDFMLMSNQGLCVKTNAGWRWAAPPRGGQVLHITPPTGGAAVGDDAVYTDDGPRVCVRNITPLMRFANYSGLGVSNVSGPRVPANLTTGFFTTANGTKHGAICHRSGATDFIIEECPGAEGPVTQIAASGAGRIAQVGFKRLSDGPLGDGKNHYCANDGTWTTDLDIKDEVSCTRAGNVWTGTKCCSEDDDPDESYNDLREGTPQYPDYIPPGATASLTGIVRSGSIGSPGGTPPPCGPGYTDSGVMTDSFLTAAPVEQRHRLCLAGVGGSIVTQGLGSTRPTDAQAQSQVPACPSGASAGIIIDTAGLPGSQSFTGYRICLSRNVGTLLEGAEDIETSAFAPDCPGGSSSGGSFKDRVSPGRARAYRLCLTPEQNMTPSQGPAQQGSIGGCFRKGFAGTGALIVNSTGLNYMGKFWGCLVSNNTFLGIQDYHAGGPLLTERGACQPAFQDAFGPGLHARCSARGVWQQSLSLDTTVQKDAPFTVSAAHPNQGLAQSDCCAASECWSGSACVPDGGYSSIRESTTGYRCDGGNWTVVPIKFSPDYRSSGFCRRETQCLVNDAFNPDLDDDPAAFFTGAFSREKPKCIASGQYIKDNYCDGGLWTSRTKLLALSLAGLAENVSAQNYTVYCDEYKEVLNRFSYLADFGLVEDYLAQDCPIGRATHECVSKVCALEFRGGVAVGGVLNAAVGGSKSFLRALNVSPASCDSVPSGAGFGACAPVDSASLFYDRDLNLAVFVRGGGSVPVPAQIPSPLSAPLSALQQYVRTSVHADSPLARNYAFFERLPLLDRLYFASKGSRQIFAFFETDKGAQNTTGVDYIGADYKGFEIPQRLCDDVLVKVDSRAVCAEQPPLDFFAVAKRTPDKPGIGLLWKDLTAKLRPR